MKFCYFAIIMLLFTLLGFPGGSEIKVPVCNAGDLGLIPGSGRFPGEGNGTPLQYSCLENPMDRGAWWVTVHGVAKSRTRLSDFTFTFIHYITDRNTDMQLFSSGKSPKDFSGFAKSSSASLLFKEMPI